MGTLVQSWARSARVGVVQGLVSCAAVLVTACGSAPVARTPARTTEASACVGGLCVRPDHVLARRVGDSPRSRCLVVAWDGDGDLPPTARMGVTDGSPARPGVFAAVDLPTFAPFTSYPITEDPSEGRAGASVFAARVDPAVRFAENRIAEHGDVRVDPVDGGARVTVTTRWGDRREIASFVVPSAANGCMPRGGTP